MASELLPYDGEHFRMGETSPLALGERHLLTAYPPDVSGSKRYRINALGFRGDDFDPRAPHRIFAAGCSYTFGTGLNEDEIWIAHFAKAYAAASKVSLDQVNLLNFSQDGASNAYIARTVLAQCRRVKPDVVIVLFTHAARGELVDSNIDAQMHRIGPWLVDEDTMSGKAYPGAGAFAAIARRRDGRILRRAESFFRYHSPDTLLLDTYRNILLVQYALDRLGVRHVLLAMPGLQPTASSHPTVHEMYALIDQTDLVALPPYALSQAERAADSLHPGPTFHRDLGEVAWQAFNRARS